VSLVALMPTVALAKTGTKLSFSVSSKYPAYGAQVKLKATLKTSSGKAIKGKTVTIQRWSGSAWVKVKAAKTNKSGVLATWRTPYNHALTKYRARFAGTSKFKASTSAQKTVKPKVYLSYPDGPQSWTVGSPFNMTGLLLPAHSTETTSVIVKRYWGASKTGPWTFEANFTAKLTQASSGSTYTASVVCPNDGHTNWRFVTYMPADSLHAATWSEDTIYYIKP
jgi:5-hydroxyisourate hydrolase-like protein (transthyretin family)